MYKGIIIKAVKKATGEEKIKLGSPEIESFGDYSFFSKDAQTVAGKLKEDDKLLQIVGKIEVMGGGFINFWLKDDILNDVLLSISSQKDTYGRSDIGKEKKVIVDYSSPNIAKRFSIGHLRSTIIGQALYNLYEELGYEVIGDNHLGDWGTQFGKLLYMLELYGLNDFDVDKLEELYVEFHTLVEDPKKKETMESAAREWFKRLEDGDKTARKLWQKCWDVSMAEFNKIYELLGVKIDYTFGESVYLDEMKVMEKDKDILKYLTQGAEGSSIVDLSKYGIKTPLMFLKSDGATTYATRDLACIRFRVRKWNPDIIIYEVGGEQTLHFQQLFAAAKELKLVKDSVTLYHTKHGLYLSPDGKKFRTREGGTVKLEDVLNEAIERAKKLGSEDEKTAQAVGVGAIKYFDLKHGVISDIIFDWEKVINMEGDSGPYLQYTYARIQSVLAKADLTRTILVKESGKGSSLFNSEELSVLRALVHFPEIIKEAAFSYSPNLLCKYLYALAQKYNTFYNQHRIIGSDEEELRLKITFATGQVLKNGLKLLGITTPERM